MSPVELDYNDEIFGEPGNIVESNVQEVDATKKTVTIIFSSTQKIEVPVENVGGKRIQLTDKVDL